MGEVVVVVGGRKMVLNGEGHLLFMFAYLIPHPRPEEEPEEPEDHMDHQEEGLADFKHFLAVWCCLQCTDGSKRKGCSLFVMVCGAINGSF